jgi:hypothetical protein
MAIHCGFESIPLGIIQTICFQLNDEILILLIRENHLNNIKKLLIDIIGTWMKSATESLTTFGTTFLVDLHNSGLARSALSHYLMAEFRKTKDTALK